MLMSRNELTVITLKQVTFFLHTATHTSKVPHTQVSSGTHDSQDMKEPTCKLITYRVFVGSSDREVSWFKNKTLKNQHDREETKNSQTLRLEN